jgi:stress-induced morphogen
MSQQEMKNRLESAFQKAVVDVLDLTGTEDHYEVYVKSSHFVGLSRIEAHQSVMKVFDAELKTGEVHALSIRTEKGE